MRTKLQTRSSPGLSSSKKYEYIEDISLGAISSTTEWDDLKL